MELNKFLEVLAGSLNKASEIDSLYESEENGEEKKLKEDFSTTVKGWISAEKKRVGDSQHGRGLKEGNKSWQNWLSSTFQIEGNLDGDALKTQIKTSFEKNPKGDADDLDWESIKKLPAFKSGFDSVINGIKTDRDAWKDKAEKAEQSASRQGLKTAVLSGAIKYLNAKTWKAGSSEEEKTQRLSTIETLIDVNINSGRYKQEGKKILVLNAEGEQMQDSEFNDITFEQDIHALNPFGWGKSKDSSESSSSSNFVYNPEGDDKKKITLPAEMSASEFATKLKGTQGEERALLIAARKEQLNQFE